MRVQKHSLRIAGHQTSITLEAVFWECFQAMATEKGISLNKLAAEIDNQRTLQNPEMSLTSALRVRILEWALNQNPA